MKVICDRAALADAVNVVNSVVVSRTPTPVLQCMKLTAADGVLTLAATDLEVGLRIGIDQVDIEEPGDALVPADKLTQIVRSSEEPTLTLYTEDQKLHIKSADSHFTVFGYNPSEAPEVRDFANAKVDARIPAKLMRTLVSRTLFAAAAENSRYAINGVLYDRNGTKLRLVATDGRRLAVATGDCETGEGDSSAIIPSKALKLFTKLVDDPDAPVQIAIDENLIVMQIGDGADAAVLSSTLVEGTFPPFEDVIPKDQDKKVQFDSHALTSAIRRAAVLTNEESKGVRLSFADKLLTLTSRAPDMGEAEVTLEIAQFDGDPLEIGFNPSYIVDALNVVDSPEVIVELKAPNKPGVIRTGKDFTYVLMPVNLQ